MIPVKVRDIVYARAGFACERCGADDGPFAVHHRRPRAMGGTRRAETNSPPNLLLLCDPCHLRTESHRAEALEAGWLVRQTNDPAQVPVLIGDRKCLLTNDFPHIAEVESDTQWPDDVGSIAGPTETPEWRARHDEEYLRS